MASSVPQVQSDDRNQNQLQSNIITRLNQVLINPLIGGNLLSSIVLAIGDNTINHGLGRALVGWIITRGTAASTFFDKQATNTRANLTLVLNSSAVTTVSIYVF